MKKKSVKIKNEPLKNKFMVGQKVINNGNTAKITSIRKVKIEDKPVICYDIEYEVGSDKAPTTVSELSVHKSMAEYDQAVKEWELDELKKLIKKYGVPK